MVWHILGWVTVASQVGLSAAVVRYLYITGCESRTWLKRLPIPKPASGQLVLSSGSDHVGLI